MRIHVYLPAFPVSGEDVFSGTAQSVHGLAVGLVENGAQVTILCNGEDNRVVESPSGYDIRCLNGPPGLEQYFRKCDDPGLLLLNGIFDSSACIVSRICRRRGIPYIVAPHDPYHPTLFGASRHFKWPHWYLRERPMLRHALAIQVPDFRHAEWLRALGVQTPVVEVPDGYSSDDVYPESSLTWRTEGPPKILCAGRLDPHNKSFDLLLAAFSELMSQSDAQLTVQAADVCELKAMQHRAARFQFGNRVQFCAPVSSSEHDIVVSDLGIESFDPSALKSMLAARVLLVSSVACIAPHVRASGCGLVISTDVNQIKSGLIQLISMRQKWKEMGFAGREYAMQNLSWNHIAAAALAEYRLLLPADPSSVVAA